MTSFLPTIATPFRLPVGLRRIDPSSWIQVDDDYAADLVERERVLDAHLPDVVADVGSAVAAEAGDELLSTLVASLPVDAGLWARRGDVIEVLPTGALVDVVAHDPLLGAAHLVADDLCLLDGSAHVLLAAAVCFPNRWRLADKLGRHVTEIHDPVPGYRAELAGRVTQVLDKLRPGTVLERRNWSLLSTPALYQPERPVGEEIMPPAGELRARVERQTLRRLPVTGAIVFGIRTRQRRLDELDDGDRSRLATALRDLPDDTAAYKDLTGLRATAIAWLERCETSS